MILIPVWKHTASSGIDHSSYHVTSVKRDKDGIEIDPNYKREENFIPEHMVDVNRRPKTSRNVPAMSYNHFISKTEKVICYVFIDGKLNKCESVTQTRETFSWTNSILCGGTHNRLDRWVMREDKFLEGDGRIWDYVSGKWLDE